MTQKVLSYDLGGTKLAAGVVNRHGGLLTEIRVPALFAEGKEAVLKQMVELGKKLITQHKEVKRVGIASAGPLDMRKGILLDPTNFVSSKGSWGIVPLTRIMRQKLRLPVALENDAAASVLAEKWVGAAKKYKNIMVLTLGTGLGTGIVCNGELVRAGRHLHTEAGHLILRQGDLSAPCGCGNVGCAEAYLSGKNFTHRARLRLKRPNIAAAEIADLARKNDPLALAAFAEYAELMATAIHNYAKIYCPEIVVFTGSFAKACDLFLEDTTRHLRKMLLRSPELVPKLVVSSLENDAGLIGGAYVAFHH